MNDFEALSKPDLTSITSLATVCSAVKTNSDADSDSVHNKCSWRKNDIKNDKNDINDININPMPKVYNDTKATSNNNDGFASLMTACSV